MSGCSTLSCKSKDPSSENGCLSGRKICAFCLGGRTAEKISHTFSKCSNLLRLAVETASPLPLIKICTCEDSEIQKAE